MANWWEAGGATGAVGVYQPIGAASLAASYSNLANPGTYDAAPGVAPTFSAATGWTFNGTTQYLTIGSITIGAGWSALCRFSGAGAGWLFGVEYASQDRFHVVTAFGGRTYYRNGGSVDTASYTSGVAGIAGQQGYKDGATDGGAIASGTWSGSARVFVIGGANFNGVVPSGLYPGNIQALAIYNTTLSGAQVEAVTTCMQGLPSPCGGALGLPVLLHHWQQAH